MIASSHLPPLSLSLSLSLCFSSFFPFLGLRRGNGGYLKADGFPFDFAVFTSPVAASVAGYQYLVIPFLVIHSGQFTTHHLIIVTLTVVDKTEGKNSQAFQLGATGLMEAPKAGTKAIKEGNEKPGEFHFPWLHACVNALVLHVNAFALFNVFPYAGYMVVWFGKTDDKDQVGYYAGFLLSAFMIGRSVSSLFWGLVADYKG